MGDALNAINIESDHLDNLFVEGQGAGGKPLLVQFFLTYFIYLKIQILII